MNVNEKFINYAIEFVRKNNKPFTFKDFALLGYSRANFNQLVRRNKDDILKIGKDKYFPKSLLKSINTQYSLISDNISDKPQSPLSNPLSDPDLLIYFLYQNIHNIRSTLKNVTRIYSNLKDQDYQPEPNSALHEIKLDPQNINFMDTQIKVFPNDTVQILIGCSRNPIILNDSDIDKLTNTYEQLRQYLSTYASFVPTLDYMRITQFDYARDAVYYKVGNFNTVGLEFPTFKKLLVKIYYPTTNMIRFEQPNVNNELSINQLKQIVDQHILPLDFNSIKPEPRQKIIIELDILGAIRKRRMVKSTLRSLKGRGHSTSDHGHNELKKPDPFTNYIARRRH